MDGVKLIKYEGYLTRCIQGMMSHGGIELERGSDEYYEDLLKKVSNARTLEQMDEIADSLAISKPEFIVT